MDVQALEGFLTQRLLIHFQQSNPFIIAVHRKIVEEIGIKGKGVKMTPLKGEERNGVVEDSADVRIEGLTANEMINLVYRLEKGSRPISLKKANLRVRFDDPSRFDLALTVALPKLAPGQAR